MVSKILRWFGYHRADRAHSILVNRVIQAAWDAHVWLASDGDLYDVAKYHQENRAMLNLEEALAELKEYEELSEHDKASLRVS